MSVVQIEIQSEKPLRAFRVTIFEEPSTPQGDDKIAAFSAAEQTPGKMTELAASEPVHEHEAQYYWGA